MITINIFLDEHTKESGCIYTYPKTHREGLSNVKKLGTGYGNPDKPGHLVEVDKNDYTRIPHKSAYWYGNISKTNNLSN